MSSIFSRALSIALDEASLAGGRALPIVGSAYDYVISSWRNVSYVLGSAVLLYGAWALLIRRFLLGGARVDVVPQLGAGDSRSGSGVDHNGASGQGVDDDASDERIGSINFELCRVLRPISMFCELGNDLLLEIVKKIEEVPLKKDELLFRVGQTDDCIFIVQHGRLVLELAKDGISQPGGEHALKQIDEGDSVFSLLSFVDVLTGHTSNYRSVSCRALRNSLVLRVRSTVITNMLNQRSEWLLKCVQVRGGDRPSVGPRGTPIFSFLRNGP